MASPVLSVEKHTITLSTEALDVTALTFISDSPPDVQMTKGAGNNMPSMVQSEQFYVEGHTTHDGQYKITSITTDQEDYIVEALTGSSDAATAEDVDIRLGVKSGQADLTNEAIDITNCIPFVSTRVVTLGKEADSFSAYAVRADFVDDTIDKVRVRTSNRDLDLREIVCEVTVVEFDPAEVNVYQGEDTWGDSVNIMTLNDPYGGAVDVDLAKSFLYFNYVTNIGSDIWRFHTIRGVMTDLDTLTFDATENQGSGTSITIVNWYVAEAINTAWAVDQVAIQLADAIGTNEDTSFSAVTEAKTFILGSYKGSDGSTNTDGNEQNTINIDLTDSTTVTASRVDGAAGNGIIDWAGFVVELAGDENVYRGDLTTTQASPDTGTSRTTTAVVVADSMVHTAGMTGTVGGSGDTDDNSDDPPGVFYAWTFASSTEIDCEHYIGMSTFEAATVSWEVIEWDVGGAPPVTRRVMVIS
jgi:hypothetical protein